MYICISVFYALIVTVFSSFFKREANNKSLNYTPEFHGSADHLDQIAYNEYFSKCCPPGLFYTKINHSCSFANSASDRSHFNFNVDEITPFLPHCDVIVDYVVKHSELENFIKNYSIVFDNKAVSTGSFCFDNSHNTNNSFMVRLCYDRDFCITPEKYSTSYVCLKKCCADGFVYTKNGCKYIPQIGIDENKIPDIVSETDNIAIFHDRNMNCEKYRMNTSKDKFTIASNGSLFIPADDKYIEFKINDQIYCTDIYYDLKNENFTQAFYFCIFNETDDIRFLLGKVALILSCICLIVTILVYVFVHKLKKIVDKIIVSYCISHLITCISITLVILYGDLGIYCKFAGFSHFFGYIASFSWLNVLSYDLSKNIASMKTRGSESKKIIFYSLYAWSIPVANTILFYLANEEVYKLPSVIHPYLGVNCIIEYNYTGKRYGHILFLILPAGMLIVVNGVFFSKTISYFLRAKRELSRLCTSNETGGKKVAIHQTNIIMILKLSMITGLTWIMDLIMSVIDFKQNIVLRNIEVIVDIFTCLNGVYILLIFVVKWKGIVIYCRELKNYSREEKTTTS